MAAVSLFWDTNMAAMMSCENTLLGLKWLEHTTLQPHGWSHSTQSLLGQLVFHPFYKRLLNREQHSFPIVLFTWYVTNEQF